MQQAVSQRGFSMVHMGDDAEVADVVGHSGGKYT
jgi:hypothetical protein